MEPLPTPPPSLLGLGRAWTRVGYAILALSVLAFVLYVGFRPFLPLEAGKAVPTGYRLLGGKGSATCINTSPGGIASVVSLLFSGLAGLVWTFVDVVDRRKRFVWLLPMFICPLVQALHALPLALYLFYGRETIGHGEGVK